MAVETHTYEVKLESRDPKFTSLHQTVYAKVQELVQIIQADKIESQIRAWILEHLKEFKEAPLWSGGGASHLWISLSTTTTQILMGVDCLI